MEDKIPNFSLPAQSFPSVRCQSNWIQFNSRMVSEGIKHLLVSGCILTLWFMYRLFREEGGQAVSAAVRV